MALTNIEYCRPIPDNDPLFNGIPTGSTLEVDGVLYVRMGEWLVFLQAISAATSGSNA